jgi:formylglycine-generating enzyme required for sulfatase activity/serine/threonine protein kinase
MAATVSDDAFARAVNQMGAATLEHIEAAKAAQAQLAHQGQTVSLADVMVQQGLITAAMRESIEKRLQAQQAGGIKQLGQYRLLKKLGEGGMGAVYLAEDINVARKVAVKVLPKKYAAEQDFLTRFRREAQATGRLNHVNIVMAYTVGEELGQHFYAMEYCEGETLDRVLKHQGRLPWDKALEVTIQVARGLQHAHEHDIIHRDIKPANVFICKPFGSAAVSGGGAGTEAGATDPFVDGFVAKILDLGLSKSIGASEQSFYTQTGVALGTPHYISPEQAKGDKGIDGRTDIYSLGAMLYHLVTGQTPFTGSTAALVMMKHLTEQLPNPQDIEPDLPDGVVQIIMKMMAKAPDDRYASCKELLDDLELVLDGKMPSSHAIDVAKSSVAMARAVRPPRPQAPSLDRKGVAHGPLAHARGSVSPRGTRQHEAVERRKGGRRTEDGTAEQAGGETARKRNMYIAAGVLGLGVVILLFALLRGGGENGETRNPKLEGSGTVSGESSLVSGGRTPGAVVQPETRPAAVPAETALPKELAFDLGGGVKMEFVLIPAGDFMMGADDGEANEKPIHRVRISTPFYLGKYEVTVAQFKAFADATKHVTEAEKRGRAGAWQDGRLTAVGGINWRTPGLPKEDNHPVVFVTWNDARAFCDWAAMKTGRRVRLPTEAQWEYACRAGSTTRFHTGNSDADLEQAAWFKQNSGMRTHAVGQKKPSAWGLYDMHGNAWEWVQDCFGEKYYSQSPPLDPTGPNESPHKRDRVLRGGGWSHTAEHCRAARRHELEHDATLQNIGFRCALDVPGGGATVAVQPQTTNHEPRTTLDNPAHWTNAVNLLPLVDPKKDAVNGAWEKKDAALAASGNLVLMRLPYRPPEEYDCRVELSTERAQPTVGVILPTRSGNVNWALFGGKAGFEYVDNKDLMAGPTAKDTGGWPKPKQRGTVLIQVRRGGLKTFLDGKLFYEFPTDYANLKAHQQWTYAEKNQPALGVLGSVTFHKAEILDVTGKGTFARPDDPAAKEAEKKQDEVGASRKTAADQPATTPETTTAPAPVPAAAPAAATATELSERVLTEFTRKDADVAGKVSAAKELVKGAATPEGQALTTLVDRAAALHAKALASLAANPPKEPVQIEKMKLTGTIARIAGGKAYIKSQGLEMAVDVALLPSAVLLNALGGETSPEALADRAAYAIALGDTDSAASTLKRLPADKRPAWANLLEQRAATPPAAAPAATPAPKALPKEASLDLGGGVKMDFMLVPAGEFMMGSDNDGGNAEKPAHKVKISKPFYMGKYEITVAQFRAFADAMKFQTEAEKAGDAWTWKDNRGQIVKGTNWRAPGFPQQDNSPVCAVTWNDAQEFVKWAARKTGRTVSLPTEAQWEYACRAGTATRFPGGDQANDLEQHAWCLKNSGMRTNVCGQKKANAWGLYDMHGNVWEWVQDGFSDRYYAESPPVDPTGPATGGDRVLRGGCWADFPESCRAATRGAGNPGSRDAHFGFRVAVPAVSITSGSVKQSGPLTPGLWGSYWVKKNKVMSRVETKLSADCKEGSPDPAVPNDWFNIRFGGVLRVEREGKYAFLLYADDYLSLYIDGGLLCEAGVPGSPFVKSVSGAALELGKRCEVMLTKGDHNLKIEYHEATGNAQFGLFWKPPGGAEVIVPPEALFHDPDRTEEYQRAP